MFTGIIRHIGSIQSTALQKDGGIVLEIRAPFSKDLHEGDSVAVDGACLTVLSRTDTMWTCRLMAETMKKTTLGLLQSGTQINLELPAKADDLLHGHIVQGHVDGVCTITNIAAHGDDRVITFKFQKEFLPHISPKGSIALDGVSLTVVDVHDDSFTVSLMPYTLEHTTLGIKKVGDAMNMETDHTQDRTWLSGTVVRGDRRGTALGFPTANITLDVSSTVLPEGIFACRAMIENDPTIYAGALHVGPRPTFADIVPCVELHLINFAARDLYASKIRFSISEKIRDVMKFNSPEALVAAISQDVAQVTSILMYP